MERKGIVDVIPIQVTVAPWLSGSELIWQFQRPTRVEGFEVDLATSGILQSLTVSGEEQLVAKPIDLIALLQWYPYNSLRLSCPNEGWKIGPILLPVMKPGDMLRVLIVDFKGRMRPFGAQVR